MAKLLKLSLTVPDSYPENSPVEVVYPSAYYAQARAAGGMVEGKLGSASGGFRPILSKAGADLLVYGGEIGDPLPPLVEIRVKPRGTGVRGVQWEHSGHPRDTGGGAWDGSEYGQPGERMATAGLVKSLEDTKADAQAAAAEARTQGQELAARAETAQQEWANIKADTAQLGQDIENKTADLLGAAPLLPDAQAAAAARPDAQAAAAALPDARAAAALLPDVQSALTALGSIPTALSGLRVTPVEDGYLFEADPATTTPATVQAAPLGGLLYEVI